MFECNRNFICISIIVLSLSIIILMIKSVLRLQIFIIIFKRKCSLMRMILTYDFNKFFELLNFQYISVQILGNSRQHFAYNFLFFFHFSFFKISKYISWYFPLKMWKWEKNCNASKYMCIFHIIMGDTQNILQCIIHIFADNS